jgi:UDP:flavonoid glycosyltransferase YjiC (YdhE family)
MPDKLKQFFETGAPPVYITFGSMIASDPNPREITRLLINAVRGAGCRAIIQSNWHELADLPEFPEIYRIDSAPHHQIFPHCALVVHHGGAGTTQAATTAGCPSVIVEHASDQPLWGSVLQREGLAPHLLHRRSITARKPARAIKMVLHKPDMNEKAKAIASIMQQEDGVTRAIKLIESVAIKHEFRDKKPAHQIESKGDTTLGQSPAFGQF